VPASEVPNPTSEVPTGLPKSGFANLHLTRQCKNEHGSGPGRRPGCRLAPTGL
jgi:hypothetical protein